VGKVEMGQGIRTALAQVVAEELEVPFASVQMVMGETSRVPHDNGTYGSLSVQTLRPILHAAAAEAREILCRLAAERWSLAPDQVKAENARIVAPNGQAVAYGELTEGKRLVKRFTEKASEKPPEQYRIVGTSVPTVGVREMVTGATRYAADWTVPAMLHGKVLRPPAIGAKPTKVDAAAARGLPGVVAVVHEGDFIGVAADTEQQAEDAARRIKVEYDKPSTVNIEAAWDSLDPRHERGKVLEAQGEADVALEQAKQRVLATYRTAYVYHATMEPQAAVADVTGERVRIWTSTQRPFGVRGEIARLLGVPESQVELTVTAIGGGFGRKNAADAAPEAARLSRAVGKPVRVVWTRGEDFKLNPFRSFTRADVQGGFDAAGRLTAWDYRMATGRGVGGQRDAVSFYAVPNQRTTYASVGSVLRTGSFRGLGAPMNAFARECFMDELAESAGRDPVALRLAHLPPDDTRTRRVIEQAAARAAWEPGPPPTGRGRGFACCAYRGTTRTAEVAEVEVDRETGRVRVRRVVAVQDSGLAVNPANLRHQIEGGITMSCSYTLGEEILWSNGWIVTASFGDYKPMAMTDVPEIEAHVIQDLTLPSQGAGEPPAVPLSAAVANAVYDAIGVRLRELPLTPERVLAAIAKQAT